MIQHRSEAAITAISAAELLRKGTGADQFAFLTPGDVPAAEEAMAVLS